MAEELQMVEGSPDYELESQNGYLTEFNMTLLQICHISNSSILNQLQNLSDVDLIEACTNRPILPPIFGTFVQIFYALVCLVGLCGNTLVIYVVLRYSKMQTVIERVISIHYLLLKFRYAQTRFLQMELLAYFC